MGLAWVSRGLEECGAVRREMEDRKTNRYLLDIRLTERARAFAIDTGQIEGLYLLRRGVTEQLVTEGLESVRSAHSVAGELDDDTLRGLFEDQEETLEIADDGDLRPFAKYLADLAMLYTHYAAVLGQQILKGRDRLRHGNGGVTANGKYCPPPEEPST